MTLSNPGFAPSSEAFGVWGWFNGSVRVSVPDVSCFTEWQVQSGKLCFPEWAWLFSQVHTLRHTGATFALQKGVPIYKVSKILGHRDISMTYGVYRHLLQEEQAETLRLCEIAGR